MGIGTLRRGWKQPRIVLFFGTKNHCWGAKWPNSQSNCTQIQIFLFWGWQYLPAEKWHSKKKCWHVLTSIEGQHPRLLYLARTSGSWVCITNKAGLRLWLLTERGWITHFESISLPPGNNRPQQGRKIRNQGLPSFQEDILANAQDATKQRSTGHQHHTTSSSWHKDVTKPQHCTAYAWQDSGYRNSSIYTLYTAEILQQANDCSKEETRATTLCMAWHVQ